MSECYLVPPLLQYFYDNSLGIGKSGNVYKSSPEFKVFFRKEEEIFSLWADRLKYSNSSYTFNFKVFSAFITRVYAPNDCGIMYTFMVSGGIIYDENTWPFKQFRFHTRTDYEERTLVPPKYKFWKNPERVKIPIRKMWF